jgi:hypothetical protein
MILPALLLFLIAFTSAYGQEFDGETARQNLSLDIYLYNTGKALVTGYADNIEGLAFLKPAQYTTIYATRYTPNYRYENDTRQLYAWTDTLTLKQGETWKVMFSCWGFYNECRIVLHLPGNLRLGRINSSKGLNYLVSASNDSLLVDAQAYHAMNPSITVEYQQPLEEMPPKNIGNDSISSNLLQAAIFISALALGSGIAFLIMRKRKDMESGSLVPPGSCTSSEAKPLGTDGPVEVGVSLRDSAGSEESQFVDISDDGSGLDEVVPIADQTQGMLRKIEVSREMMAVIDTLTPRERSIVEVLIKNGGRMTQTDMRYETGAPKSSLTMALISLEKRKLVTRREWGRTNVVEISERFLSGKDRS